MMQGVSFRNIAVGAGVIGAAALAVYAAANQDKTMEAFDGVRDHLASLARRAAECADDLDCRNRAYIGFTALSSAALALIVGRCCYRAKA